MIISIKHKGLKKLWEAGDGSKLPANQVSKITKILLLINVATRIEQLNFSGSYFHQLKGEYEHYYSVRVTGNYRIIFQFENGNAYLLDYVDYH